MQNQLSFGWGRMSFLVLLLIVMLSEYWLIFVLLRNMHIIILYLN